MKVGKTRELNEDTFSNAKRLGLDAVVFFRVHPSLDISTIRELQLHDISNFTKTARDYAYIKVTQIINNWSERYDGVFNYKGYDLRWAITKDCHWTLLVEHSIEQRCNELSSNSTTIFDLDAKPNQLISIFKLLSRFIIPIRLRSKIEGNKAKNKIAIRVNSEKVLPLMGNLLVELGTKNFVTYQSSLCSNILDISSLLDKHGFSNLSFESKNELGWKNNFQFLRLLFSESLHHLNIILSAKNRLKLAVAEYEALAKSGVTGFLLNAGENEGEGMIAGMVAEKFKIKSFNFMNGTKFNDLMDQHTNFTHWFVHDEKLRDVLAATSNQKKQNFVVVGHLLEDKAHEHKYSKTLDKYAELLKGKKIIALFSSPLYNQEKVDVALLLNKFLNENNDLVVLIRKHPSEKQDAGYTHERSIVLPDFKEKSTAALFDLMQVAHIAISFGSTVSLQASWFNVPSANYEYLDKSMLYYIDQQKIYHFNKISQLEKFINDELNKPKVPVNAAISQLSVAFKMREYLLGQKN